MKGTDFAYIAALIDSVGVLKIEPPKKALECCLYVWITHKDFKLMEYLQRAGAFIINLDNKQFRAKWKDQKALRLLEAIIPFSQMKKEQIKIGISFMVAKLSETKEPNYDIPYRLRLKMWKKSEETNGS